MRATEILTMSCQCNHDYEDSPSNNEQGPLLSVQYEEQLTVGFTAGSPAEESLVGAEKPFFVRLLLGATVSRGITNEH